MPPERLAIQRSLMSRTEFDSPFFITSSLCGQPKVDSESIRHDPKVHPGCIRGRLRVDLDSIRGGGGWRSIWGRSPIWGRLRVDSGSVLGRSGIDSMSIRGRLKVDSRSKSIRGGSVVYPGSALARFLRRFVADLGSIRGRLGADLGLSRGRSGVHSGTIRGRDVEPFYPRTHFIFRENVGLVAVLRNLRGPGLLGRLRRGRACLFFGLGELAARGADLLVLAGGLRCGALRCGLEESLGHDLRLMGVALRNDGGGSRGNLRCTTTLITIPPLRVRPPIQHLTSMANRNSAEIGQVHSRRAIAVVRLGISSRRADASALPEKPYHFTRCIVSCVQCADLRLFVHSLAPNVHAIYHGLLCLRIEAPDTQDEDEPCDDNRRAPECLRGASGQDRATIKSLNPPFGPGAPCTPTHTFPRLRMFRIASPWAATVSMLPWSRPTRPAESQYPSCFWRSLLPCQPLPANGVSTHPPAKRAWLSVRRNVTSATTPLPTPNHSVPSVAPSLKRLQGDARMSPLLEVGLALPAARSSTATQASLRSLSPSQCVLIFPMLTCTLFAWSLSRSRRPNPNGKCNNRSTVCLWANNTVYR